MRISDWSSDVCSSDLAKEFDEVELRHRHQAGTELERYVEQHGEAVDVAERQQREDRVVRVDADPRFHLRDVGDEVAVREEDALRNAAGARGVWRHRALSAHGEGDVGSELARGQQY